MTDTTGYSIADLRAFLKNLELLALAANDPNEVLRRIARVRETTIRALDCLKLAEDIDVRTIDVAETLRRIPAARPDLAKTTTDVMRSLAGKGVRMFVGWRAGDPEWWVVTTNPPRSARRPERTVRVKLRVPLRDDFDVRPIVPSDLHPSEAELLANLITSAGLVRPTRKGPDQSRRGGQSAPTGFRYLPGDAGPPGRHTRSAPTHEGNLPLSTPCLIGVVDPGDRATARLRYVHADGYPTYILPTLALIWSRTCRRDTATLAESVLAHQWSYLGVDVTADAAATFDGERPEPGIGMVSEFDADTPLVPRPLSEAADGDAQWVYLIDTADSTVAIYHVHDLSTPTSTHQLADLRPAR